MSHSLLRGGVSRRNQNRSGPNPPRHAHPAPSLPDSCLHTTVTELAIRHNSHQNRHIFLAKLLTNSLILRVKIVKYQTRMKETSQSWPLSLEAHSSVLNSSPGDGAGPQPRASLQLTKTQDHQQEV